MDHFGIGAAIIGSARIYMQAARQSGRTTSLVESVKDGDLICFTTSQEASRVKQLCVERGVKVECIVVDPRTPHRLLEHGTPTGRTIFDHTWVEQFFLNAIESAQDHIDRLQRETSGYGTPHLETRRRAEELAKWR